MSEDSGSSAWRSVRRLLAVRLDTFGDVLMTTPALAAAKASLGEQCSITLLTSPTGASVADLIPEIDHVIEYEAAWLKATPARDDARHDLAMIERLRESRFDASIIFTVYSQNPLPSALLCFLADIPLRMAHCHENPYQLLTEWVRDPEPEQMIRHEVRRQLDLVAHVGWHVDDERLRARVKPSSLARMKAGLARDGVDLEKPWLVVHPGATASSRRYPAQLFAQAAELMQRDLGLQLVFTGSADETGLVDEIVAGLPGFATSLAGRLGIRELAAVINLAPALLVNNTGPAHLAAALGTPVAVLYALTNPQHAPWQVPSRVLFNDVSCRYCYRSVCPKGHHLCLRGISPSEVVHAVDDLFSEPEIPLASPLPAGDLGPLRL